MSELPLHRERPDSAVSTPLALSQLREFDAVLDARSPAEYGEDHLPGAICVPVLDDAEREHVGTIYKQQSAFDAKRVGAPLVARNIARHIETLFADRQGLAADYITPDGVHGNDRYGAEVIGQMIAQGLIGKRAA